MGPLRSGWKHRVGQLVPLYSWPVVVLREIGDFREPSYNIQGKMKDSDCRCLASCFVTVATSPMYLYNCIGKGDYIIIDWVNLYQHLYLYNL